MSVKFNCTFIESEDLTVYFGESSNSFRVGMDDLHVEKGIDGKDGITFIPAVSEDGILSWTNDGNLENPEPIKIGGASVGEDVSGTIQRPFDPNESGGFEYIYEEPQEALPGAEIFNSYHGDVDGMGVEDYDRNVAIGFMSQASGFRTQAIGNYSRASGWWTRADGQCAVAEGLLTRASGHFTHAEGTRTLASINNAHAEGDMTKATGRQSHAEGQGTLASGFCSHAEGSQTQATNYYSHAEGLGTIAAGRNQTAMGKYNVRDTSSLLIVGNGTKDSARSNAFKLDADGNGTFAGKVTASGTPSADNDLVTVKYMKDNIATTNTPTKHTHTIDEVEGLEVELEAKADKEHSHSYNDLSDLPTIPSDVSQLNNDMGYITINDVPETDVSNLATKDDLKNKADKEHEHSYKELTDLPTIPSIEGLASEEFVTNKIAEAQLGGGDVDLSGYATKTEVENNTNAIKQLQIDLGLVDAEAKTNTDLIKSLQEALGVTNTTVESNTNSITALQEQLGLLEEELTSNSDSIKALLESLGIVETNVTNNTDAIAELEETLSTKADSIHSHDIGDITGLENELNDKVNSEDLIQFTSSEVTSMWQEAINTK